MQKIPLISTVPPWSESNKSKDCLQAATYYSVAPPLVYALASKLPLVTTGATTFFGAYTFLAGSGAFLAGSGVLLGGDEAFPGDCAGFLLDI